MHVERLLILWMDVNKIGTVKPRSVLNLVLSRNLSVIKIKTILVKHAVEMTINCETPCISLLSRHFITSVLI